MIKYSLKCKKCTYVFDSWFSSSSEYDKIKELNLLSCSKCNSQKIVKSIMAPNVNNFSSKEFFKKNKSEYLKKIFEYQSFIRKNFEYVGNNFSYEARSIHYDKKFRKKPIYGNATTKEIKELNSEGIETYVLPWVSEKTKDN